MTLLLTLITKLLFLAAVCISLYVIKDISVKHADDDNPLRVFSFAVIIIMFIFDIMATLAFNSVGVLLFITVLVYIIVNMFMVMITWYSFDKHHVSCNHNSVDSVNDENTFNEDTTDYSETIITDEK